jgi:hypothetical protein
LGAGILELAEKVEVLEVAERDARVEAAVEWSLSQLERR